VLLIEAEYLLSHALRYPSIRRPPPLPMQYASIALLLNPSHQPSHLSCAQPCYFGSLLLGDRFLQSLMYQVEPSDLTRFHHQ
jgi:hypothetical protein